MRRQAGHIAGEPSPWHSLAGKEGWMIARIWHGMVPAAKGEEYLDLMRRIALPEYLATQGNRGGWGFYPTQGGVNHFWMLTFLGEAEAIKRFSGDDYST